MTCTLGNTETRQACSTMHGAALNTLTFFFFFGICMHIYTDRYTYAHTHTNVQATTSKTTIVTLLIKGKSREK